MDDIHRSPEIKRTANDNDTNVTVMSEKQAEDASSHYLQGSKSGSGEKRFADVPQTDMDDMVYNFEDSMKITNDNDDGHDTVLVEIQEKYDNSHCLLSINSGSRERIFSTVPETDMDDVIHNFEDKMKIANDDGHNTVLVEKQAKYDNSDCLLSSNSGSRERIFSAISETGVESRSNCSLNVLEKSELSDKQYTCVKNENAVKNFQNLSDADMENGINDEHVLSCLKKLQCPFVWKPDKEVEAHPKGEVPINLVKHLTEKELGFICAETDLFREVTIYLVLAYHKYITLLPKEGLLDIYHCYDILLKAEKEIINETMEAADKDGKRKEMDVSNESPCITQSLVEALNHSLANNEVLPVYCSSEKSSQGDQNDYEDMLKTKNISDSSVTLSTDNSRCLNQKQAEMEFLPKNNLEETELFAKLFDTKTHFEWRNAKTVQKDMFESWNTESNNNNNENWNSSAKLPSDKAEKHVEIRLNNHNRTEKEIERELQKLYALQCVTSASLAYFAFSFGYGQDAMKIVEYIEKLSKSLSSVGEAVVLALRGAVLCEYGYAGNTLAIPWINEALKLDPDSWEWNLYYAKTIGRLRRNEKTCNTEPSEEEIQMLKKAVELNPTNPSCLVHLANAYRSVASAQYRQRIIAQAGSACDDPLLNSRLQRNWRCSRSSWRQDEQWKQMPVTSKSSMEYLTMANKLYLDALKYGRNCPYTNARCAKGFWSMPNPFKDKKMAQKAILHALCLSPDDSLVNHHAGMFYEYVHDYEKALKCYEIATQNGKCNYPAEMNYINLRLRITAPGSYSPIFRLHELLHKYNGVNHMVQTLCLRGYYHYEAEKILLLAIQNFAMAIELKPTSPILMDFYPGQMSKNFPESINIYDLLEQILQDFEKDREYNANKDIVKYATDILTMRNKIKNESCASSTEN